MNINAMMARAKKMQAEVEKQQKLLAKKEFKVEKQGITVRMSGARKLLGVEINEILIDPDDKETLEDMIIIAINEILELISAEESEMQPSMPGTPF